MHAIRAIVVLYFITIAILWIDTPSFSLSCKFELQDNELLCRVSGTRLTTIVVVPSKDKLILSAVRIYSLNYDGRTKLEKQIVYNDSCNILLRYSLGYYNFANSTLVLADSKNRIAIYDPLTNSSIRRYNTNLPGDYFSLEGQYESGVLYLLANRDGKDHVESILYLADSGIVSDDIRPVLVHNCMLYNLLGNCNGQVVAFRSKCPTKHLLAVHNFEDMTTVELDYNITGLWLGKTMKQSYYEFDPGTTRAGLLGARNIVDGQYDKFMNHDYSVCSRACATHNIAFTYSQIDDSFVSKALDAVDAVLGRSRCIVYTTASPTPRSVLASLFIDCKNNDIVKVVDNYILLSCERCICIFSRNGTKMILLYVNIFNISIAAAMLSYAFYKRCKYPVKMMMPRNVLC